MKVKVGNKIYDGENEPVMVILSAKDKENISKMLPSCSRYVCAPYIISEADVNKWIKEVEGEKV